MTCDREAASKSYGTKPRASVRGKDIKAFLRDYRPPQLPENWLEKEVPPAGFRGNPGDIRVLLSGELVVSLADKEHSRPLSELWDDVLRYFRAFNPPDISCLGTAQARLAHRELGRGCFLWFKYLLASSYPWDSSVLRGSSAPKWFADLNAMDKRAYIDMLQGTYINYPQTCLGVGVHAAFEHMVDIFDILPWAQAERVVEEAFDHFFSYLYHLVPAVANRSLRTARNATTTWMVILEAHAAGIPPMGAQNQAKMLNSAYL